MAMQDEIGQAQEKPSYLQAMLGSPANIYTGLGAAALGTALSFPFGFAVAMIPVVCFAAGEAIAAMYVPNSSTFRAAVDLKYQRKRRELTRRHLLSELAGRLSKDAAEFSAYQRMLNRIASLRTLAAHRESSITEADVERLDDSCVDYLSLTLARQLLEERRHAIDVPALKARQQSIEKQLASPGGVAERGGLQKALDDVSTVLARHNQLESRKLAVEAAMLSMLDTVEEIYHNIIANPNSSKAVSHLQSAVERLQLEKELDYGVDEDNGIPAFRRMTNSQKSATEQLQ